MPFAVTLSGPSDRHYRDLHGGVMLRRAPHGELAAGLGRYDELSLAPEFQPLVPEPFDRPPDDTPAAKGARLVSRDCCGRTGNPDFFSRRRPRIVG